MMTPDALPAAKRVQRHLEELAKAMEMDEEQRRVAYGTEGPKVMVQYALQGIEAIVDALDIG